MRQLKDAAEHERAVETTPRRNDVPGNKPQYFRGALIKKPKLGV